MTGCVEWEGTRTASGYGVASWSPRVLAHRQAWLNAGHTLPAGLVLHHQCGNPACVNVEHMQPMTRSAHVRMHRAQVKVAKCGHPFDTVDSEGRRRCLRCWRAYTAAWKRRQRKGVK